MFGFVWFWFLAFWNRVFLKLLCKPGWPQTWILLSASQVVLPFLALIMEVALDPIRQLVGKKSLLCWKCFFLNGVYSILCIYFVCGHMRATVCEWRSEATFWNQSSPSTVWILGVKFRLPGLAASAFVQLNHLNDPELFCFLFSSGSGHSRTRESQQ